MAIAVPLAGQSAKARYSPPRTGWGVPDLQGFYNVATITPLERPANYGNRLALTDEEASALERAEAQRDQKLDQSSAPAEKRTAPQVGGDKANPNATYLERLFEGGGGTVGRRDGGPAAGGGVGSQPARPPAVPPNPADPPPPMSYKYTHVVWA
jgi:hypothetical protein